MVNDPKLDNVTQTIIKKSHVFSLSVTLNHMVVQHPQQAKLYTSGRAAISTKMIDKN